MTGIVHNGNDSDEFINGTSDNDTLSGGGGNDNVYGGEGDDVMSGGSGDDRILMTLEGDGGNDTADGGEGGWDSAIYDYRNDTAGINFVVTADTGFQSEADGTTDELSGFESVEVFGGSGNDTIVGDSGSNFIEGRAGDDTLTGGGNGDTFGFDFTEATGTDRITDFTAGQDTLHFRSNQITSVVSGNDPSALVAGQMMVDTGAQTTVYVRGEGGILQTIVLDGTFTASQFTLSTFDWGTNVGISPPATDGDDNLMGGSGNDSIDGLGGNDFIDGGAGDDTLSGGTGDDFIMGGSTWSGGTDVIDGGEGNDTVHYNYTDNTSGITFNISTTGDSQVDPSEGTTDTLTGIEFINVGGGSGNDVITGGVLESYVDGNAGNDTLTGGTARDTFAYNADEDNGQDRIVNLGTNDSLWFHGVHLTGPMLQGDNPSALAVGEAMLGTPAGGITMLYVQTGGPAGLITIELAGNYSRSNFSFYFGGDGTSLNFLQPTSGNDVLWGGTGHDYIEGLGGNDNLGGGEGGDDTLIGGDGNDTLSGGNGDDLLDGGAGSDAFNTGDGDDTVIGGEITDRINYTDLNSISYGNAVGPITLNLETGLVIKENGTDQLSNINFVTGSGYDDTLIGSNDAAMFEQFDGGNGDDTIDGGGGANRVNYFGAGAAVTVVLGTGEGGTGDGYATGARGNDTLININNVNGTAHGDTLIGSDRTTSIEGFNGRGGNDTIDGAGGMDHARYDSAGSAVTVNLALGTASDGEGGTDELHNIESVRGSRFGDTLIGSDTTSEDTNGDGFADYEYFIGMAGDDTINGAGGWDRADYTTSSAGVIVSLADGKAWNDGYGTVDTLTNIEALRGSEFADDLTGDNNANRLEGMGGDDTLVGGGGNDTLLGGAGYDVVTYAAAGAGVTVDLLGGTASDGTGGTDTLGGIENVIGSEHADTITGDAGNNDIMGLAGDDIIVGGDGSDTVHYGPDGGATGGIVVDLAAGTAQDGTGSTDSLSGIENVIGTLFGDSIVGDGADNHLEGLDGSDYLQGGSGVDTLLGGAGDDTLGGGLGGDLMDGGDGFDTVLYGQAGIGIEVNLANGSNNADDILLNIEGVVGSAHADQLTGSNVANVLDGGAGADTLAGGGGHDTYFVDDAGDVVTEAAAGGTDTVNASASHTLADFVERLVLTGGAALKGTGNTLDNTLTGNTGANVLDGKAGADTMAGGTGNDTYVVDNAGDRVTETAPGGVDTVKASITYTLGNFVEGLTLTGNAAINGTGNTLANTLTGNAGANVLDGKAGADKMAGGAGNDTYIVDNAGDRITETATGGTDTVKASVGHTLANSVENLTLTGKGAIDGTGNTLANKLTGNASANVLDGAAGADVLNGGAGNDTLIGGTGKDALTGGGGADRFVFANATHSSGNAVDSIADFLRGTDKIDLSALDANAKAAGVQDFKFIGAKDFGANATGQLRFEVSGGKLMLLGSTDADAAAEFAVEIVGLRTLGASDLIL
ncbi:MAG: Hemolysin-type calcium-binding region [Ramlibacter sp.]|nr:Hemolysin-type calcium-binding region [Ramlibacter sp.]